MKELFDSHALGHNRRQIPWLEAFGSPSELLEVFGNMSDSILQGLLKRQRVNRFVDHTPWYGQIADFIHVLYPDAYWVHVVREPAAVEHSLAQEHEKGCLWAGETKAAREELRENGVRSARTIRDRVSPGKYIEVRYEDLVGEPESTMSDLLKALDLPWDQNVLSPLQERHAKSYVVTHPHEIGTGSLIV